MRLYRDAANTLAQRNGTNAQESRLYNTYTDAANYARKYERFSGNDFDTGVEAGGTGVAGKYRIDANSFYFRSGGASKLIVTSSSMFAYVPLQLYEEVTQTPTWNDGGTAFTAFDMDITDTASDAGSMLADWKVDGVSKFRVDKTGEITVYNNRLNFSGSYCNIYLAGTYKYRFNITGLQLGASRLTWGASASSNDLILERDAAGTLAQRNGTNAQESRLYNTYTDAANYARKFERFDGNDFVTGVEAGGTGVAGSYGIDNGTIWFKNGGSNRMFIGFNNITCYSPIVLNNAATAETPTATHTVTIKDSTGTTYKLLAVPA